jgi:hypothetical protein
MIEHFIPGKTSNDNINLVFLGRFRDLCFAIAVVQLKRNFFFDGIPSFIMSIAIPSPDNVSEYDVDTLVEHLRVWRVLASVHKVCFRKLTHNQWEMLTYKYVPCSVKAR